MQLGGLRRTKPTSVMTSVTLGNSTSIPFIIKDELRIDTLKSTQQRVAYAPMESSSTFEIIWIKNGKGLLIADMNKFPISSNAVYCFAPGQPRKLESTEPVDGYYLSFSESFLKLLESPLDFSFILSAYANGQPITLTQSQIEMEDLFVKMHREFNGRHFLRNEILKSMLKVLIVYLSSQFERLNQEATYECYERDKEIVRKFLTLLRKSFSTKRLVAEYADELCITPNYLNAIVKKQTGIPASHHIQQCIISEAKRHAMYSCLSMKEIADRLGFEDYAHFSKFFKNYSGMNFTSFRKQLNLG